MFITDRLVYLRLQKTGSTHTTRLLEECVGGKRVGLHKNLEAARYHTEIEDDSLSTFAGFMTYRYLKLYTKDFFAIDHDEAFRDLQAAQQYDAAHNVLDAFIRTEKLEEDLSRALREAGYALDDSQFGVIRSGEKEKTNTSQRRPTSYYYDAETVELVSRNEHLIIEKHGYEPPTDFS